MSVPAVTVNELDGQIGTLPVGTRCLVVIGDTSTGTANTPASYARTKDVVAGFTSGRAVEAACRFIQLYNKPVIVIKAASSTIASKTAIVTTNVTLGGTSVITAGAAASIDDDYEVYVTFVTGGTIAAAGITYQYSLDGGRTLSAVQALGVATTITIPGVGIAFSLAAGTVVAGASCSFRTTGPTFTAADLAPAILALKNYVGAFDVVEFAGAIDATIFDAIETGMATEPLLSKVLWIGHFRIPTIGETEAAYKTAFDTAFSAKATTRGMVCAGACESVSAISARQYMRPVSFEVAGRIASESEEIDAAAIDEGQLIGVNIADVNGNPKYHDERLNPGLDDSRATTLRTFDGVQGVYINNPRILCAAGSDFEFAQHRRIMNLARGALIVYFQRRLSKPILVDRTSGNILEAEARDIEAGANALLDSVLLAVPKASDVSVVLNRTNNILSTKTLLVQAFIVPLAYPKAIIIDLGFRNPVVQAVNT
jgi:hypothetical protein